MYRFKRLNESQAENIQIKTHHNTSLSSYWKPVIKKLLKGAEKETYYIYRAKTRMLTDFLSGTMQARRQGKCILIELEGGKKG